MKTVKPQTKPKAKPRATWLRSSRCVGGDCLEARRVGRVVVVRDSKLGEVSPLQRWGPDEWHELLGAVRRAGPLSDGVGSPFGHVAVAVDVVDGRVEFGLVRHEILSFTFEEWNAFVAGVLRGEFDFENLPTPAAAVSAGGSVAARGTAAAPAGPPPVNPCAGERYGQDPEAVLAVAADGESCLPEAAHPIDSPAGRDFACFPNASSVCLQAAEGHGLCVGDCERASDLIPSSPAARDQSVALVAERSLQPGQPGVQITDEMVDAYDDAEATARVVRLVGFWPNDRTDGMVCGRCEKPTGNNTQGHHWSWCKVTRRLEVFHFCCPGDCDLAAAWREAYELLAEKVRGLGVTVDPNKWDGSIPRNDARWLALVAASRLMSDDMAAWERLTAPLVDIPESSSVAGGDSTDEPVAVAALSAAAGGEVVPDPVGVRKAGTTEPEVDDGVDR